ncbi:hypothetical protein [Mycobacterium sp. RTGN5]|uniref:hypothetical protein n=1 Tax=Mycobacterium sp. RTGN5 TaxID=3016522 RepID=UPI0029C6C431|nr:hypothetical protein [Mycobacterium sp. RTGN5]
MSEQTSTAATQSKKRGVAFPQLSLQPAVEAIVAMGQHGADHSQDAAAAYLGHSTTNSGAYRNKLAALRDWGLIKRGDADRVILSDLAKDLVLAAPDHALERSLLLAAFDSCRVFEQLYEDSAKDLPQDLGRFRTAVVMRHGVATDQADRFLTNFIDSAEFAGLAKFDGNQVILLPRNRATAPEAPPPSKPSASADIFSGIFDHPTASVPPTELGNQVNRGAGHAEASTAPPTPIALRQSWPIDGGEIEFVIRTPKALPPSIYAVMAEMAEVAAKMEKLLKPAPADDATDDNVPAQSPPADGE